MLSWTRSLLSNAATDNPSAAVGPSSRQNPQTELVRSLEESGIDVKVSLCLLAPARAGCRCGLSSTCLSPSSGSTSFPGNPVLFLFHRPRRPRCDVQTFPYDLSYTPFDSSPPPGNALRSLSCSGLFKLNFKFLFPGRIPRRPYSSSVFEPPPRPRLSYHDLRSRGGRGGSGDAPRPAFRQGQGPANDAFGPVGRSRSVREACRDAAWR
jgi:hypothetical protein